MSTAAAALEAGVSSGGVHDTHLDATDEIRGGVRFVGNVTSWLLSRMSSVCGRGGGQ